MAWEKPVFTLPAALANADLSSYQYYIVKKGTTDNQVQVCATDGEIFLGVLQNKPDAANDPAEVMVLGVTNVVAGETLAAGDHWGTDSSGKAKKVETTITGADVGDYVGGVVLEGGSTNELVTVTVGIPTFIVEAQ